MGTEEGFLVVEFVWLMWGSMIVKLDGALLPIYFICGKHDIGAGPTAKFAHDFVILLEHFKSIVVCILLFIFCFCCQYVLKSPFIFYYRSIFRFKVKFARFITMLMIDLVESLGSD